MAKKDKLYYESESGKTFKEAFAEARSEGKKTFEWNGEKYNTELKKKGPDQSEAETKRLSRSESSEKEDKKPTNRGAAAALAGAGVGMGAMALMEGMKAKRREDQEKSSAESGRYGGRSGKYVHEMDPMITGRPGFDQGPMKKGGAVKSASSRGDGIAQRGKTRGRMV